MARPTKCRRVCRLPETLEFAPVQETVLADPISLTIDEYEALRLIDLEGLSQEQCSTRMQVARTTAQKIYDSGRKKLARMLVEGLPLQIQGGDVRLCDGQGEPCSGGCHKQQLQKQYFMHKGDHTMRIAVTYENGYIFQHFGHTETFKVYDVADGKIVSSQVIGTDGQGHGALAQVLYALQADVLICGGIGGGAQNALASVGIKLYGGVSGEADAAVQAFLDGKLDYNPNVMCSHHGEHHHEEGHSCGDHGCGGHCH